MKMVRSILATIAAAAVLLGGAAYAANTTFLTSIGDTTFPFSPPTPATGGAGAIDNTVIGATTAKAGNFTTLTATSGPTINGDAGTMCATYFFTGTPAATNQVFFLAPRPMIVTAVSEVHATAAGGTSTLDVFKDTSTNAPAGGATILGGTFNLNGTANTVQVGTLAAAAARTLAAGDRLSVKFNNAIQSSAGVVVTACGQPL